MILVLRHRHERAGWDASILQVRPARLCRCSVRQGACFGKSRTPISVSRGQFGAVGQWVRRFGMIVPAKELGDGHAPNYGFTGERLAWVDRRCCPQPLATMIQPISITGEASAVANKVYIYATSWGEMTSATAAWARAEALGWRTHRWPCSHEVMIEKPGELAELIGSL